jgi:hypothetical protein
MGAILRLPGRNPPAPVHYELEPAKRRIDAEQQAMCSRS